MAFMITTQIEVVGAESEMKNRTIRLNPSETEPWIGNVHVRPNAGSNSLGPSRLGAYANIIALARSEEEYKSLVREEMKCEELLVIEFDDIATVDTYRREGRISKEIDALCDALSTQYPVQYKTFDCYSADDA